MNFIDGSAGAGGGQILRTCLALSIVTGKPFRIEKIRHNSLREGLTLEDLETIEAAADICGANVHFAAVGDREFTFEPDKIVPGEYRFNVGRQSAEFVLETIVPTLLVADQPSTLCFTDTSDFTYSSWVAALNASLYPLLRRMGANVQAILKLDGCADADDGSMQVLIEPTHKLQGLFLDEPFPIKNSRARAIVAKLLRTIAERELLVVAKQLAWPKSALTVEEITDASGAGNLLSLELENEWFTEFVVGHGAPGLRAETVAQRAVDEAKFFIDSNVAVGQLLANQLLIPLALGGSGSLLTMPLSRNSEVQINLIPQFLDVRVDVEPRGKDQVLIRIQ